MSRSRRIALAGGAVALGSMALLAPAAANASGSTSTGTTVLKAHLTQLNNSGANGSAAVSVKGDTVMVIYKASGLLAGMPHAAHIHFSQQARHECPTVKDDANHDHRLNVAEGVPAYGAIVASLTTRGDTSPASALAVDRFSAAPSGVISYSRSFKVSPAVADAVRMGKAVVVIHGLDYNGNGKYDFSGAGKSEIDPSLPAEATDPATCGDLDLH